MTQRSQFALATLSVLATIAIASTAEARPGQGRGQEAHPRGPVVEAVSDTVETAEDVADAPVTDLPEDRDRGRVGRGSATGEATTRRQNLPPGLQRQVDSGRGLPPGLQRQVDSGRGLPPGLQRGR